MPLDFNFFRNMKKDFLRQEERIEKVLSKKHAEFFKCNETLETYRDFLIKNLVKPVEMTGVDDFDWEEFFIFGPGSKKEYERLKKTRPSYKDTFILDSIEEEVDEFFGLLANVTREKDKKTFQIPLADLRAIDEDSKNYQLLDDYSVWCINY